MSFAPGTAFSLGLLKASPVAARSPHRPWRREEERPGAVTNAAAVISPHQPAGPAPTHLRQALQAIVGV
jgi:hypothetical protein